MDDSYIFRSKACARYSIHRSYANEFPGYATTASVVHLELPYDKFDGRTS